MTSAATPRLEEVWPQAVVLVTAGAACAWAVSDLLRRERAGLPLLPGRPHVPVPWEAADVAMVVVAYLLGASLLAGGAAEGRPLVDRLVANAVLSLGTMLAAFAWLRFRGASWADIGFPSAGVRDFLVACRGLAVVVFPLLVIAAGLNALVRYEHPVVDFLAGRRDPVAAVVVVVSAVVVAPLTEEFFFRRVLQGWLEKHFADERGVAVALSSIAFASAHAGQGLAFLPLFPLALVLGAIAERTGSIVPCVLLHGMFNAVSVFLLLAQPGGGSAAG
jgi:membrane protease YdiL (CAAX protease family)